MDNYVVRKKYSGLEYGEDGQVQLSTAPVPSEELVASNPNEDEPRKNGGGVSTRKNKSGE